MAMRRCHCTTNELTTTSLSVAQCVCFLVIACACSAPKLLSMDANRISRQSCLAWTVYVVLDIYANFRRSVLLLLLLVRIGHGVLVADCAWT